MLTFAINRAEPLEINIYDDWSSDKPSASVASRPVELAFTVEGSHIAAILTVGTIPKLIVYANKFKETLSAQQEGAARESKAFRVTRMPQPDNPLSAVANAMIESARTRFTEAEASPSFIINQRMSLRLGSLRMIVYPRTMNDSDMAQFVGGDVEASLVRKILSHGTPETRDVRLSFTSMTISRFSQVPHGLHDRLSNEDTFSASLKSASESNIVGLPSMILRMVSDEEQERSSKKLLYDFNSQFIRREDTQDYEDIYITLNMSLYQWLTVLRKNLARELDQALSTTEKRNTTSTTAGTQAQQQTRVAAQAVVASANGQPARSRSQSQPPSPVPSAPLMSPSHSSSSAHAPSHPDPPESSTRFPKSDLDSEATLEPLGGGETGTVYVARSRDIERLTMRQLGEATPDVTHPFFMKTAGFNLEDSLPQYVHEYATVPLEQIMEALLKLYSKQLLQSEKEVLQKPI